MKIDNQTITFIDSKQMPEIESEDAAGLCLENDKVLILREDGIYEYSRVSSKEHALKMIEGLNKAIELGWLK